MTPAEEPHPSASTTATSGDIPAGDNPATQAWLDLALVWGVSLGPLVLSTFQDLAGVPFPVSADTANSMLAVTVFQQLTGLAVLGYVLRRQGRRWADIGMGFRPADLPDSVLLLIVSYLAFIITYVGLPPPSDQSIADGDAKFNDLRLASLGWSLTTMFLNPWFEELIVRAYPMVELERLTGRAWLVILATPLVQAFYHLYQGWQMAVSYGAMFLIFSIYYYFEKRAAPLILAHLAFDLHALYQLHSG